MWFLRLFGIIWGGGFAAAGAMATAQGLLDPLDVSGAKNIGPFELVPFGLLFLTLGFIALMLAFRKYHRVLDYLEGVLE